MLGIAAELPERYIVFYNGPLCGASAPDHMHFQAGSRDVVPLIAECGKQEHEYGVTELDWFCRALMIRTDSADKACDLFRKIYDGLEVPKGQTEPMMNVVAWKDGDDFVCVVIPRRKHRPDCYSAEGNGQMLISPGALDMCGLIITPREEDFRRISREQVAAIIKECGE